MRKFYFFLVFIAFATTIIGQRPVASYSFDGGSLVDNSGSDYTLQSVSQYAATFGYNGEADGAVNISGTGLYLEDTEKLGYEGQITVASWVRISQRSNAWVAIINKWSGGAGSYYLGINPASNAVRWNCAVGNIEDPTPVTDGEWIHYAASYNGQVIKLYRNGVLVNSLDVFESEGSNDFPFRIGIQSNGDVEEDNNYQGDIDEVNIYNVALTDIEVAELYENNLSSEETDLVLYDLTTDAAQIAGERITVKGVILNNSDQVASDISLEINNGSTGYEESLAGVEIAPHASYDFEMTSIFQAGLGRVTPIGVQVLIANDANPANNSRTESVIGYDFFPEKKVVVEEGTGTWCGFCPRGALALEEAYEKYPDNFIGIAVHNRDPMTVDYYDTGAGFDTYPSCHVDRRLRDVPVNRESVDDYVQLFTSNAYTPFVGVTHVTNYNAFTRELTVISTAKPALPLEGFYVFSLVLTEDGVTGTDPAFGQVNFFADNALGEMGGYELLPNPVPADQMVYDHVARVIVGENYIGNTESLLTELELGQTYSFVHQFTIPEAFNVDNLNVISLFIDGNGGSILNAESSRIAEGAVTAVEDIPDFNKISVYPNPSSGVSNLELVLNESVELAVNVSDISGKLVSKQNYGQRSGYVNLPLDLHGVMPGIYLVTVSMDGYAVTKKLVIR